MDATDRPNEHELLNVEFSEGYAESFLDAYIATQIKVLREDRGLTQAELAFRLGTHQTVISRVENINYSGWNISTLKKLARAFDVRLKVSFETYGSLISDMEAFSRESLKRCPRASDPVLLGATHASAAGEDVQPLGQDKLVRIDSCVKFNSARSYIYTDPTMPVPEGSIIAHRSLANG